MKKIICALGMLLVAGIVIFITIDRMKSKKKLLEIKPELDLSEAECQDESNKSLQEELAGTMAEEKMDSIAEVTGSAGEEKADKAVYWTPSGKSYHVSKECAALARSKVIKTGTIAESGKGSVCDKCR